MTSSSSERARELRARAVALRERAGTESNEKMREVLLRLIAAYEMAAAILDRDDGELDV